MSASANRLSFDYPTLLFSAPNISFWWPDLTEPFPCSLTPASVTYPSSSYLLDSLYIKLTIYCSSPRWFVVNELDLRFYQLKSMCCKSYLYCLKLCFFWWRLVKIIALLSELIGGRKWPGRYFLRPEWLRMSLLLALSITSLCGLYSILYSNISVLPATFSSIYCNYLSVRS